MSDSLQPMDWTPQASPSMGFSRQEYWSGLPCPPPGDLPHPGIKPESLTSPANWQEGFLPLAPPGKPYLPTQIPFFFFSRHFTFKTVQSEGCGAVMSHSTVWRERWAGRLLTLAQFSTSGELGLLAAVVTFKRPLKMEYSGDIKRYALYLLISEGFFHWLIFFVLFFVCVRERGNVVSYLLFFLTFSWTSKEDFIWKMWKRT